MMEVKKINSKLINPIVNSTLVSIPDYSNLGSASFCVSNLDD